MLLSIQVPPREESLPDVLETGAFVIYSHFDDPIDGGPPTAPPLRPSRRLQRGEMRNLLGVKQRFKIIADEHGELITRGVWMPSCFYAAS